MKENCKLMTKTQEVRDHRKMHISTFYSPLLKLDPFYSGLHIFKQTRSKHNYLLSKPQINKRSDRILSRRENNATTTLTPAED